MPEVTQYTERILIVLNPDASIKGIAIDDLQLIDGVAVQQIQVAADTITDTKVKTLLDAMGVSAAAEVLSLRSQAVTLQAEIDRLTALVPAPVADYMITPAVFIERLEAASPGVIERIWESDTKEAGRLAVTLFTWTDRIDCRSGGRLEGYLNIVVALGFMAAEDVAKVWIE